MRRRDKLKNIVRANLLAEQRYLKSKGLITESVEDVMMNLKNQQLLGGYIINIIPSHETLTIEIASEPDQQSGKLSRDFDKFRITYFYTDKEWDLSDANTQPSPEDDSLLEKIGSLVSAEKQKEAEYIAKQKQKLAGLSGVIDEDSPSEGRTTRAANVVFSHLSDIPLDKANVRKRAEFIKFIINKCDSDLNKDIDPDALWTEFSKEFTEGVLNEGSDTYFETLSAALDHVRGMAKKMGYELDEDAVHFQFGTGGISYGQTKSATIPLLKDGEPIMSKSGKELNRAISVSIYRMDSGRYELTAYKTF